MRASRHWRTSHLRSALIVFLLASLLIWPLPRAGADPAPDDAPPSAGALAEPDPQPVFVPVLGEPPPALIPGPGLRQVVGGEASGEPGDTSSVAQQNLNEQATLETRQPEVQWSAAGAADWQTVPTRQTVAVGDRVRTGPGASARLVYFEGTVTDIGPETGLLVQRLERTPGGNIVTSLFQSVGTTVNRVVQLVDPSAGFQIETPAATAFVRGTMPRVDVARSGSTRVSNIPDNTGGLVDVVGKDPNATRITLQPGQFTDVTPGGAPSAPRSLSALQGPELAGPGSAAAAIAERQQQRQQQQQFAQQQLSQAQNGLIAIQAGAQQLALQEQQFIQQINRLLAATPTPTPTVKPPFQSPTPTRPGQVTATPAGTPTATPTTTLTPLPLPTLATGQLRIVLTWGATPRDLDSHLWVPTGSAPAAAAPGSDPLTSDTLRLLSRLDGPSPRFGFSSVLGQTTPTNTLTPTVTATPTGQFTDVFFGNRGSATSPPFATLDIDVTTGFGPETITIERLLPGQYTYAVHNFSNEAPLSSSGAQVQVLSPTGVVATFTVPAGSGRWWTVFTLNGGTGAITPVNTISNSPPLPSAVGP